jgi:hypothetical protein
VKVGDDEVNFAGDAPTAGDSIEHVVVKRGGKPTLALSGKDIDLERSQGDIGLFVPDAGYPFGEIPDWLIRQRAGREASEILMRGMKKTTTVTPRIIIQEEEEKKLGVQP